MSGHNLPLLGLEMFQWKSFGFGDGFEDWAKKTLDLSPPLGQIRAQYDQRARETGEGGILISLEHLLQRPGETLGDQGEALNPQTFT